MIHDDSLSQSSARNSEGIGLNKAIDSSNQNAGFDEFAGSWSPEVAADFDRTLAAMRTVDLEDWKNLKISKHK